jgi:hypothetical protein
LLEAQVRPDRDEKSVAFAAIESGVVNMFELVLMRGFKCSNMQIGIQKDPAYFHAGKSGQKDMLDRVVKEFPFRQRSKQLGRVFEGALAGGHMQMAAVVLGMKPQLHSLCGETKAMLWARSQGLNINLVSVAKSGNVEFMEAIKDSIGSTAKSDIRCCSFAAREGHLEMLKWLVGQGFKADVGVLVQAFLGGNLACVPFLVQEFGFALDSIGPRDAASGGNVEFLKLVGGPFDEATMIAAARSGSVACVQYLREHNCPWTTRACAEAAGNGHSEALRFLHENGCPWDVTTCIVAARAGHVSVLRYCLEHDCPMDDEGLDEGIGEEAAVHGGWKVLECLEKYGYRWNGKTLRAAVDNNRWDCVRWLLQHHCPLYPGARKRLAEAKIVQELKKLGYFDAQNVIEESERLSSKRIKSKK